MTRWVGLFIVALTLSASALVGCGPGSPASQTSQAVHLSLTVPPTNGDLSVGATCDMNSFGSTFLGIPGGTLNVRDGGGNSLGTAKVPQSGMIVPRPPSGDPFKVNCEFKFDVVVDNVSAQLYRFEVLGTDGKKLTAPSVEGIALAGDGWTFAFGR